VKSFVWFVEFRDFTLLSEGSVETSDSKISPRGTPRAGTENHAEKGMALSNIFNFLLAHIFFTLTFLVFFDFIHFIDYIMNYSCMEIN
jgi:hypothetical protein